MAEEIYYADTVPIELAIKAQEDFERASDALCAIAGDLYYWTCDYAGDYWNDSNEED